MGGGAGKAKYQVNVTRSSEALSPQSSPSTSPKSAKSDDNPGEGAKRISDYIKGTPETVRKDYVSTAEGARHPDTVGVSGPALPRIESSKRVGGKAPDPKGSKDRAGAEHQDGKSSRMSQSQGSKGRNGSMDENREPDRVRSKDTSEDGKWHSKHCNNKQLVIATTIQQAYPFDPYASKKITKKEEHFGMSDRKIGFGEISIPKTGPRKLNCRACARLLVDVDDKDHREGPFYYCRKCHENGRRYHICTACWQDLNLVVEDVCPFDVSGGLSVPQRSDRRSRTEPTWARGVSGDPGTEESDWPPSRSSVRSLTSRQSRSQSRSSVRSVTASSRVSVQTIEPLSAIASESLEITTPVVVSPGEWKGSITEGKYKRDAALNLTFTKQGKITGSSATKGEEITVSGTWRREGLKITVAWSEQHAWGKARVDGQFTVEQDIGTITGKLISSDGGQGSLVLRRAL